jgi:RNA polymerase sigma factor (sigma-70 family)
MNQDSKYYPKNTDLRFTPLTAEDEKTLFRLCKTTGEEADNAKEFLIKNHLLFAANLARGMVRGQLPEDEVISAANAALMDAFGRFDPEHGNRFTTYLKPYIRSAIAQLWSSKNPVKYPKGRYPKPPTDPFKTASPRPMVEESALIVDHPVEAEDHAAYMKAALEKASSCLDEVESALLTEIYEKGLSLSDVARDRKLSRQRVHQIHSAAIKKLREAMKQQGVTEL